MNGTRKQKEKRDEKLHPDLERLVNSMRHLLARNYPNVVERHIEAEKIMKRVQDFACV